MHAYKTYSEYRIYKSTNVPVLRIQASSNQYISTRPARLFHQKARAKAGRSGFVESPAAGPQPIKAGPARPVSNTVHD